MAEKYNADEQDNEHDDDDNYDEDGFEAAAEPNKNHASATGSGNTALAVQQSAPGHLGDHRSSGQIGGRTTPQTDKMSFVKPIDKTQPDIRVKMEGESSRSRGDLKR